MKRNFTFGRILQPHIYMKPKTNCFDLLIYTPKILISIVII